MAARKVMVMLTTTISALVTLPSQGRRPAHPHCTDQLDYPAIGTEGVNIDVAPVPEQLPYAVEGW